MGQRFDPVAGFPGYRISRTGVVLGKRGRPLSQQWVGHPGREYLTVTLIGANGKSAWRTVHSLVLETYIGPRPFPKAQGRHLNGDRACNTVKNLKWGTAAENTQDMLRHGNHVQARKTRCKRNHEFTQENTRIMRNGGRTCRTCERARLTRNREQQRKIKGSG